MEIVINTRLKELRKEKKETQVTVAAAIGVTEQYYQKLEYGETCQVLKTPGNWRTIST